jgi:hypothetical protein
MTHGHNEMKKYMSICAPWGCMSFGIVVPVFTMGLCMSIGIFVTAHTMGLCMSKGIVVPLCTMKVCSGVELELQ